MERFITDSDAQQVKQLDFAFNIWYYFEIFIIVLLILTLVVLGLFSHIIPTIWNEEVMKILKLVSKGIFLYAGIVILITLGVLLIIRYFWGKARDGTLHTEDDSQAHIYTILLWIFIVFIYAWLAYNVYRSFNETNISFASSLSNFKKVSPRSVRK